MRKYKALFVISLPFLAYILAHILIKCNGISICLWKNIFHTDCWGCGITRAFNALCHLDFYGAWNYNSKIYIIAPILFYVWVNEIIKTFKQN